MEPRLASLVRDLEALKAQVSLNRPLTSSTQHEAWTIGPAINSTDPSFQATHNVDDVGKVFFVPLYFHGPMRVRTLSAWVKTTGSSCVFSMGLYVVRRADVSADPLVSKPLAINKVASGLLTTSSSSAVRFRVELDREVVVDPNVGFYFAAYSCSTINGKWWTPGQLVGYRAVELATSGVLPDRLSRSSDPDDVSYVPAIVLRSNVGEQVYGVPPDSVWAPTESTKVSASSALLAVTAPILVDGAAGPVDLSAARTFSHGDSGVVAGTVGDATTIPVLTIDAKGHVTVISTAAVSAGIDGTLTAPRVPFAVDADTLTDYAGFTFVSGVLDVPTRVRVGGNSSTEASFVIASTNPASATSWLPTQLILAENTGKYGLVIDAYGPGSNQGPSIVGRVAAGTIGAPTAISSGTVLMKLAGTGYLGGFVGPVSGADRAEVALVAAGDWTGSTRPTGIRFKGTTHVAGSDPVNFGLFKPQQFAFTPVARTSVAVSASPQFLWTAPSETAAALASSTNTPDIKLNLARTVQFASGAKARQDAVIINAPTHSAVGATTITDDFTFYVDGPPAAGTNVTITRTWAAGWAGKIWAQQGGMVGAALAAPGFTWDVQGTLGVTGLLTSTVAAGSPVEKFIATSDTPATTWVAGVPSNNPAGFKEIDVGGTSYYMPYYT